MNTVKFKRVWDSYLNLTERNPATVSLTTAQKEEAITRFNLRVREAWLYAMWLETVMVDYRALREWYQPTTTYEEGREVWDEENEAYYLSLQNSNLNHAVTETDWWEEITDLDRYLPQNDLTLYPLGTVIQITKDHPYKDFDTKYSLAFKADADGYWLMDSDGVPDKVYVEFRMIPPTFTLTEWIDGGTYTLGDIVYRADLGECYQYILVDGSYSWNKVDFPRFMETFVKLSSYSDWLRDDGRVEKADANLAQAYVALENERNYQVEQQGQYIAFQGGVIR